jgi:antitoxin Phd
LDGWTAKIDKIAIQAKPAIMGQEATMAERPAGMAEVSATEAKNAFGAVLDKVMAHGGVAIVKHRRPTAVLLSMEAYEALLARQQDALAGLRGEFDALVARQQTDRAAAAGRRLFQASPNALGRAARAAARRRR